MISNILPVCIHGWSESIGSPNDLKALITKSKPKTTCATKQVYDCQIWW
jgi:hypothetical protein